MRVGLEIRGYILLNNIRLMNSLADWCDCELRLGYLRDRNAAAHSVDSDILATFILEYEDDYEYEF